MFAITPRSLAWFPLAAALTVAALQEARAAQFRDLAIKGGSRSEIRFEFSGVQDGGFPPFFQKATTGGKILVSFLETKDAFPLGSYEPQPGNGWIKAVTLKKLASPSGRTFLAFEFELEGGAAGEWSLKPKGSDALAVNLKGEGAAWRWSLGAWKSSQEQAEAVADKARAREEAAQAAARAKADAQAEKEAKAAAEKAAKEREAAEKAAEREEAAQAAARAKADAQAEKEAKAAAEQAARDRAAAAKVAAREAAEAQKAEEQRMAAERKAAERAEAEAAAAREAEEKRLAAEKAAAEKAARAPGTFEAVRLQVSPSQHALIVRFQGNAPRLSVERDPAQPEIVHLTLEGFKAGSGKKSWNFPEGARFRRVAFKGKGESWDCLITLDAPVPLQASLIAGGVLLTAPGTAEGTAWNWSSDAPAPALAALPGSEPSAHAEGEKLDASPATGLRFEKVFAVGEVGAPLLLWKDATPLRTAPGGQVTLQLPPGSRVNWLGEEGIGYRVLAGTDTGFVPKSHAAFAGQVSEGQAKTLEKRLLALEKEREKRQAEATAQAETAPPVPAPPMVTEAANAEIPPPPQPPEAPAVAHTPPEPAPSFTQSGSASETPVAAAPAAAENPAPDAAPAVSEAALAEERAAMEAEKERLAPQRERITYNSFGRRDPFIPVSQGTTENGIEIDKMKVVGIVWHAGDPIAVLEHIQESNLSFTVRQGDPVHNGKVSRITRDAVTFDLTEYGITRAFTMKLVNPQERANK